MHEDENKPSWNAVGDHPDWAWFEDAPGRISKHTLSGMSYSDAETQRTRKWRLAIEQRFGKENVTAGRARVEGLTTSFALYVRLSALEES